MKIQNVTSNTLIFPDIPVAKAAGGALIVAASGTAYVYDTDALKSVSLKTAIANSRVSVLTAEQPTTGLTAAVLTGTTAAVAGEVSSHAHGLSYAPLRVMLIPTADSTNDANAHSVDLVSTDTTYIKVKSTSESATFKAYAI